MNCSTRHTPRSPQVCTGVRALGLFVAGALAGLTVHAQGVVSWNSVGPPGGTTTAVRASPLTAGAVYAGTGENGIFYSTDSGRHWFSANTGLVPTSDTGRQQLLSVSALASDGQYMYAATGTGLYYSAASGSPQWLPLPGPTNAPLLTMLSFDPATRRLFAASDATDGVNAPRIFSKTLALSADPAAAAWNSSALPDATIGAVVNGLAIIPAMGGLPGALLVAVGNGMQAASILGTTVDLNWVDADPAATLATGSVRAVSYSTDFSQAYACSGSIPFASGNPLDPLSPWLPLNLVGAGSDPFNCTGFYSIPFAATGLPPSIVLGTDQGAFASSDGVQFAATGRMAVSPAANDFALVTATGASPELLVAGGFGVGALAPADLAANAAWSDRSGPASVAAGGSNARLNNAAATDVAVLGGLLFASVSTNHYRDVLASADGGATWSTTGISAVLNPFDEPSRLVADAANGVLYVGTTQGLLAYSPAASRWSAVGAATIGSVSSLALGAHHVYAGTDAGLFAVPLGTSPAGAVPVAAGLSSLAIKAVLVAGGNVYAATFDEPSGTHAVSTAGEPAVAAGTATWAEFGISPVGPNRVTSLLLVGDTLLAGTNGGLVRYATAASPWASANVSSDPAAQLSDAFGVVNSLYTDGLTLYVGTGNNGVFIAPFGTSFLWTAFSGSGDTALPSPEVRSLLGVGSTLYAATRAGIASFDGISGAPAPTPNPTPAPGDSSSGGGAFSVAFAALLLLAVLLLRGRGPRRARPRD